MEKRKRSGRKILNKAVLNRLTAIAAVCTILSTIVTLGCIESNAVSRTALIVQINGEIEGDITINYTDVSGGRNTIEDNEIRQGGTIDGNAGKHDMADNGIAAGNRAADSDAASNYQVTGDNNIIGDNNTINNTYIDNNDAEDNGEENLKADEMIGELYLGMSKDYIKELLGAPVFELTDHGPCNLFYLLKEDDVVIRCIFSEDDLLVGYLVTVRKIAEESGQALEFPNPMKGGKMLRYGYSTVADTETGGEESEVAANLGNGGEYNYYWQSFHLLYTKGFDGFIVAVLPYGFYEHEADMLMQLTNADEEMFSVLSVQEAERLGIGSSEVMSYYQKVVHPNTYGILDWDYKEYIDPYISDALLWESCVGKLLGE